MLKGLTIDGRLANILDECSAEGLLDWKALLGKDDCQYCPVKDICGEILSHSASYMAYHPVSYMETKARLKEVFKEKHRWAKTHILLFNKQNNGNGNGNNHNDNHEEVNNR